MRLQESTITALIFDFGGVVLNLDEQRTYNQLIELLQLRKEVLQKKLLHTNIFYDFECGKITSQEFISYIHSISTTPISDEQIISAWNAMLLDLPQQHVQLLQTLKKKYRTFLLSNTNAIHEDSFVRSIKQEYDMTLQDMFEKVWYSHILGLRKPNKDIFIEISHLAQLKPEQTLFLDDREENIATANKLGFKTQLISKHCGILDVFSDFLV